MTGESNSYEVIYPFFTPGRVLKRRAVEFLRDFPFDLASVAYGEYSDGILFGFDVAFEKGLLTVSKGAVRREGRVITVPDGSFPFNSYGRLIRLSLVIKEARREADWELREIEYRLEEAGAPQLGMELGRFILAPGAVLRRDYDSVRDFATQNDTLDITRVRYAGINSPTLHPKIPKDFARRMLNASAGPHPADLAFGLCCLNAGAVHKETMERYIAARKARAYSELSLEDIYKTFAELAPLSGLAAGTISGPAPGGPEIG